MSISLIHHLVLEFRALHRPVPRKEEFPLSLIGAKASSSAHSSGQLQLGPWYLPLCSCQSEVMFSTCSRCPLRACEAIQSVARCGVIVTRLSGVLALILPLATTRDIYSSYLSSIDAPLEPRPQQAAPAVHLAHIGGIHAPRLWAFLMTLVCKRHLPLTPGKIYMELMHQCGPSGEPFPRCLAHGANNLPPLPRPTHFR
jgi:hypothetical protein